MSKGFYLAQDAHVTPLVAPIDITGGKTGAVISMKQAAHLSIVILVGVSAAAFTKIIVNACTGNDGSGPTAIPFDLFAGETAGVDVLGPRIPVLAAGYTPSANDGIYYVIELDAQQLPQGSPYVQLSLTNGSNSVLGAAVAILSGTRYGSDQSPSVVGV
jgi:hypothetical protein